MCGTVSDDSGIVPDEKSRLTDAFHQENCLHEQVKRPHRMTSGTGS